MRPRSTADRPEADMLLTGALQGARTAHPARGGQEATLEQ
jgi:hypothetical protein